LDENSRVMKARRILSILILFFSGLLLSKCDSGDDWDITICPMKCPSDKPWTTAYLEVSTTCFETKEECLATSMGKEYGCVKCDY
jgi:hypothetical protein